MDNENEQPEAQALDQAQDAPVAQAEPSADQQQVVPVELTDEERRAHLKKALESLLFITDHPLSLPQLCKMVGVPQKQSAKVVDAIDELRREMEEKGSAVQIVEVADGFQMGTKPAYAPFVKKLFSEKMTMRLSTAAHETLAIIAYKQPLTRAEIEQIRGVEVIAAIETLLEKRLVEVVGRRESVGRPLLYGTTTDFLRHFGLRSLEDLPPIDSFTVEGAPLGATETPAAAEEPARLPGCAEAQAKEFAAGEAMAEERAAAEQAAQTEPEAPAEEAPKKKSIWE